jgi:hypothetical protein
MADDGALLAPSVRGAAAAGAGAATPAAMAARPVLRRPKVRATPGYEEDPMEDSHALAPAGRPAVYDGPSLGLQPGKGVDDVADAAAREPLASAGGRAAKRQRGAGGGAAALAALSGLAAMGEDEGVADTGGALGRAVQDSLVRGAS